MQLNKFNSFDTGWTRIIFINLNAAVNDYPSCSAFAKCDRLTRGVIERIRLEDAHVALGASWKGQVIIRISIIAQLMDIEHINSLADSIEEAWH